MRKPFLAGELSPEQQALNGAADEADDTALDSMEPANGAGDTALDSVAPEN